jgi:hypothetical protein
MASVRIPDAAMAAKTDSEARDPPDVLAVLFTSLVVGELAPPDSTVGTIEGISETPAVGVGAGTLVVAVGTAGVGTNDGTSLALATNWGAAIFSNTTPNMLSHDRASAVNEYASLLQSV